MKLEFSNNRNLILYILLFAGLGFMESCSKGHDVVSPSPLRLFSFAPDHAAMDSIVVIQGSHFAESVSENKVAINGIPASVVEANSQSITIKVPPHAGDGKITVTVDGQSVSSDKDFTYVYTVSTLAGNGNFGFREGMGLDAEFNGAQGIALDANGNMYAADVYNNRIRKIDVSGEVSTLAGIAEHGYVDGPGTVARFYYPYGVAVAGNGYVYVADGANSRIRKVSPAGLVSTFAGGTLGFRDGADTLAQFRNLEGIAADASGNIYVADTYNNSIRKITPGGLVSTLAGEGNHGFRDGAGAQAQFGYPRSLAVDGSGNIYVADVDNHRIRKITPGGVVSTLAGNGTPGFQDGPGKTAQFYEPGGVAVDHAGNVYVVEYQNNRVRKITPSGITSTLAGDGVAGYREGLGSAAEFDYPSGIVLDAFGNIYVADSGNYRIRKLQ